MQPRIYTYKITFEEVPYYYYGVHKEQRYNEYYMGTPVTHKWCWEIYTPKKQILEVFDYSDESWLNAQKVETRIIKTFFNIDKWCLNKNAGGIVSIDKCSKGGKVTSSIMSKEQKIQRSRNAGLKSKNNKTGIFSLTKQQLIDNGIVNGHNAKKNKTGIFSIPKAKRSQLSKDIGLRHKENGTGVCGMSLDQRIQNGIKSGTQKWQCLETGYISNAGGLHCYQKKRGIDPTKRKQIF